MKLQYGKGKNVWMGKPHKNLVSVFVFQTKDGFENSYTSPLMIEWNSSVEVNCKLYTTKGLGNVWSFIWIEVGIEWRFNPMNFTVTSNFSSVEVWVSLVNSRLRVIGEYRRLLFVLFAGRMWYLRPFLGRSNVWISSLSG